MSFLNTENVKVFPSTRRSVNQVSARLMTEQSLVSIINKLIDTDGFVITLDENLSNTACFDFNIHGYYFSISQLQDIINLYNDDESVMKIYGSIRIEKPITNNKYPELLGQDDENLYQGLHITSEPLVDTTVDVHHLLLLQRDGFEQPWYVPAESRVRFNFDSLESSLDGGEI